MAVTRAQETCARNVHEKFDASSSQFLAQQLAGQSCYVQVTRWCSGGALDS